MIDLLFHITVIYGLTFILKDSSILSAPRFWLAARHTLFMKLFSCAYCVGFYSGGLSYFLLGLDSQFDFRVFLSYCLAGVSISGIVDSLLIRIEASD